MEDYTGKQPMSSEEFQRQLVARTQDMILNDKNELSKNNAYYRDREKDVFKSNLRLQEIANKQLMRQVTETIYGESGSIIWQKTNGMNMILDRQIIFDGKIQAIRRYHRQQSKYNEWQIILKLKNGVQVESPLYDVGIIYSETKLKKKRF